MTRFLGARGAAAVAAITLSLVGGSTEAMGQVQASLPVAQAFDLRSQIKPLVQASFVPAVARPLGVNPIAPAPSLIVIPPVAGAPVVSGATLPTGYSALPLPALVDANSVGDLDQETNCLATAVYFESQGEPLEGQLAVAEVVMNRAVSGRFPTTLCGVVKQHAQFSFVRSGGAFPSVNPNCEAWRKAGAIARIAQKHLVAALPHDVLWYHADYVSPRWREALVKVEQIGQHIFYRA